MLLKLCTSAPSEVLLTRNKEDKVVEVVVVGAVGKPSASAVDGDCLASLVSLPGMAQLPTPAGSETRVRRVLAEFKSLQSG